MPVLVLVPLADVFLAAAVMLLVWAVGTLLIKPLAMLLSNLPVIGEEIARRLLNGIGIVTDWATSWARTAVSALVAVVQVPFQVIGNFVAMVGSLADTIAAALAQIAAVAAGEVGQVADALHSLGVRVNGLAASLASALTGLAGVVADVARIVAHTIPEAIQALRTALIDFVHASVAAAETVLRAAIAAAETVLRAAIAAAVAPLAFLISLVPAQIAAAIAVAVQPLTLGLENLGQWARDAVGGILGRLGILEKLLPLLLLVPLVGTIIQTVEQFWRTKTQCVDPACNLLGDLLNGLGDVGELLTGSVLLALVAEAINNPAGAADEVKGWHDELAGLASGVTTVLAGRPI
jgi:hypothetical protein